MRSLDYAAIRQQIPVRRVLQLLDWKPTQCRGQQWRGACPLRCSPAPSQETRHPFSVHIERNLFRCFHCQRSGNQLDLWTAATGLPLYLATLNLCGRLGTMPVRFKNPQPQNDP